MIDATTGEVVGTVPLGGKPETPVLDGKGNIFVNIESKNSLAEFDAKTLTVKHTYPLAGCKGPSGIAMDTATRRIFIGCSDSNVMAIVNADTGKVIATPRLQRTLMPAASIRRRTWHSPPAKMASSPSFTRIRPISSAWSRTSKRRTARVPWSWTLKPITSL